MSPDGLIEVTDLKQYDYCPRIPFYRYCLPRIRPITYGMKEGIQSHTEEAAREERRSLRAYGLADGERVFDVLLRSETLGMIARIDLAIRREQIPEAIVVDYKLSRQPAGTHFRLQLAAYALMLEEAWHLPVHRGFLAGPRRSPSRRTSALRRCACEPRSSRACSLNTCRHRPVGVPNASVVSSAASAMTPFSAPRPFSGAR
jgi:CRISPR-associated protein Cas4